MLVFWDIQDVPRCRRHHTYCHRWLPLIPWRCLSRMTCSTVVKPSFLEHGIPTYSWAAPLPLWAATLSTQLTNLLGVGLIDRCTWNLRILAAEGLKDRHRRRGLQPLQPFNNTTRLARSVQNCRKNGHWKPWEPGHLRCWSQLQSAFCFIWFEVSRKPHWGNQGQIWPSGGRILQVSPSCDIAT